MQWSEVIRPTSSRVLRQFAGLWVVFFVGLAASRWFGGRQDVWAIAVAGLAVIVGLVGIAVPAIVRPVFVGWMVVVFPFGWTVSRVVLGVVFFGVLTPIACVFRLMGRDLLRRRRPNVDTYWTEKRQPSESTAYLRQF